MQIVSVLALDGDFDNITVKDLTALAPTVPRFGRVRLVVTDN